MYRIIKRLVDEEDILNMAEEGMDELERILLEGQRCEI